MWTLIFRRMVAHKERINERRSYIFFVWSRANKRNKSMWTLIFGRMVMDQGRITERRSYIFVQW